MGTLLLWAALRMAWVPVGEVNRIIRAVRIALAGKAAPSWLPAMAKPKMETTLPPIVETVAA